VSEATAQRWLKKPEFVAAYRRARRAVVEATIGRLQQAAVEAVEVLRRNMTCGVPAVEVRAAVAVLDQTLDGLELSDLAADVEALREEVRGAEAKPLPTWNGGGG
jgi:hypothetical protein